MTEVLHFLDHSDHPAAARHPSNGGELGTVLNFLLCSINVSLGRHRDRGDPVDAICPRMTWYIFKG